MSLSHSHCHSGQRCQHVFSFRPDGSQRYLRLRTPHGKTEVCFYLTYFSNSVPQKRFWKKVLACFLVGEEKLFLSQVVCPPVSRAVQAESMRSVNGSASVLFKQFASQHKWLESHCMQVYLEVTMSTRVLSSCSGGHYQGSSQPAQPACRASATGHHSPAASQPVAVAAAERWVTPPPLLSRYSHFPLSSTGLPHNFF